MRIAVQIKICIEDNENAVFLTVREAYDLAQELRNVLNQNMTFPTDPLPIKLPFKRNTEVNDSTEVSGERCANTDLNHICTGCPQFRSHI